MTLRKTAPRAHERWWLLAATVAMMTILAATVTLAGHGDASLTGSSFEIDNDANLKVDHTTPPSLDWANVSEVRQDDLPSGSGDDSFGNGSKEDTAVPSVVDGSIPPNKSDLKTFGVYVEESASGKFLHLYWTRVQDPSGTTNMDFEFNQSSTISANGITPLRTAGDLLITYDLTKGGTVPVLSLREWTGSQWGPASDLSASGAATGSINTSAIPDGESDGLGALSPRTFGEASVDLDFIFDPDSCESFGSAFLKSRSSDSFTAALKDFIAPEPVNISNCGSVIIRKQTDPDEASNTTMFGFTSDLVTDPADATATDFDLADDGVKTITGVVAGTGYTVTEDDPSALGYDLVDIDCGTATVTEDLTARSVTFDVAVGETIDCTFTNRARATIEVIKDLVPSIDPGLFNLQIDGTTEAADVGDGGTTGPNEVAPGDHTVGETAGTGTSLGNYTSAISCVDEDGDTFSTTGAGPLTMTVEAGDAAVCTITNTRKTGAILVSKTRKHAADGPGDHAHPGVTFTVNGETIVTNAAGQACIDGLMLGTYDVTETLPAGYAADGALTKSVTVDNSAACDDEPYAGETVAFRNTPLTNITVSVDSQVPGGTASVIQCTDSAGDVYNGSTEAFGDGSLTVNDLLPTDPAVTLTCTIIVDP